MPGYPQGYPQFDPYQPPPPPPKKKWPWVVGGVGALAVLALIVATGVILASGNTGSSHSTAAGARSATAPAVAPPVAPPAQAAPTSESARTTSRGLPTNGILKVGTDIQPGEYRITPVDASGGYWERLSCVTGDFSCIIANDNVSGDGYLSVLPSDVAVKVQGLELTPTGAPAQGPAPTPNPVGATPAGTDSQGFVGNSAARCNANNDAVAIGRTAGSLIVVCETGVGRYYYKGVRVSDGAGIEIDDPVRSGSGFVATNNGVQYTLNSNALTITKGSTQLSDEPMLQYWSN
ncbi:hypothetical protein [Speluncibacter jeojiensis]|uniref:Protein kinase n=1 Tax=Speluncibacter jeojiensis TaxID=2710754 RepID=A0A9X4M2X1_9ACTN|nr:hypothetical protein [Rhodococcus sp. D2-41]MDG3015839.1 hypothetical protein [Corynebacteriales bacterium D3-21]